MATSGQSIGMPMAGDLAIEPTGALAALTIATPNPASDSADINLMFYQNISAITWTATAIGGVTPTLVGAPSSVTAGQWVKARWNAFAGKWYFKTF